MFDQVEHQEVRPAEPAAPVMPERRWFAGAAEVDITPTGSPFLWGYPDVPRYAEAVHDPLLASALHLADGVSEAIFVACDLLKLPNDLVARARQRIAQVTRVPGEHVMITATHTHSGPVTAATTARSADSVVPPPDAAYIRRIEEGIVEAASAAWSRRRPARLAFAQADGSRLGTNRRDPAGPRIPQIPVLVAREANSDRLIAVMAVGSNHPTVLHEDSRLISGDYPGFARGWLKQHAIGEQCPFVYHMGASGNQSPRHVVTSNTVAEAARLGEELGRQVQAATQRARPIDEVRLRIARELVDLPVRAFPPLDQARAQLREAEIRFQRLRDDPASRAEVRTAECDWFGAKWTLLLAEAASDGRIDDAVRRCMPAEVQLIAVGGYRFIGWPGEVFVEFALEVMRETPDTAIITLANGDLMGYLVTHAAVIEGGYEACNGLFVSPESGERLVELTRRLKRVLDHPRDVETASH